MFPYPQCVDQKAVINTVNPLMHNIPKWSDTL